MSDYLDIYNGEPVALVNERFVRVNFPNEEPIGQGVRVMVSMGYGAPTWRIVGVVPDVRARALELETESQIYVPHGQFGPAGMTVTVRGVPGATSLLPAIREEVRAMNPNLPLYRIDTLEEALRQQVAPTRFYLWPDGFRSSPSVAKLPRHPPGPLTGETDQEKHRHGGGEKKVLLRGLPDRATRFGDPGPDERDL